VKQTAESSGFEDGLSGDHEKAVAGLHRILLATESSLIGRKTSRLPVRRS
jgi:hypothetical protein